MALCNSKRRPVEVCRIGCAGKLVYDQPRYPSSDVDAAAHELQGRGISFVSPGLIKMQVFSTGT
jgi:hypothetical protein